MDDTGALIRDEGGLIAEVRALRREVEALKRAGYDREFGAPSPGDLISSASQTKLDGTPTFGGSTSSILLGDASSASIGTNEVVGRGGSGAVSGISVATNSILGRAGSNITDLSASASQVLARLASGDVGFQDLATWATDQSVLIGDVWPVEEVTGSVTLAESTVVAVLNHTGNITVTLPTPANSGKTVFVVDPLHAMSASDNVTFATAGGSDKINNNTGSTGTHNLPGEIFFFFCFLTSGPVANWTGRRLNTVLN